MIDSIILVIFTIFVLCGMWLIAKRENFDDLSDNDITQLLTKDQQDSYLMRDPRFYYPDCRFPEYYYSDYPYLI